METNSNLIVDLTIKFSLQLISYCELLDNDKRFVLSRQLLRSGTSIGANVHEAQSPESKADFIHKMKIASKEAVETEYWLILCKNSSSYPDCDYLLEKVRSIQKVISKIISSAKKGLWVKIQLLILSLM